MNRHRTIKSIVYANAFDMGGMPIRQAFPSAKAERIDPFLLLHHAEVKVPTHISVLKSGVGPHPHRGFSPVSFIFKGGVHHRDSRGNNNIVYEGGTQWMNAGMGVIHSERPPADIFERGGVQELIQLWVNTPATHKMDIPTYFPLTADETPYITTQDGLMRINIQAGKLGEIKGPVPTLSDVNTFTVIANKGGKFYFEIPDSHNAFIYVLKGKIKLENDVAEISTYFSVVFNVDGNGFEIEALEDSLLMIGTGEPLNEPVVSHGPFVMNNQTQIMEAFKDYEMGKMGFLVEE